MELPLGFNGLLLERDRGLYSATFLTGGRIEEVLGLRVEHFQETEDLIIVKKMPLLKRYEKISEYIEKVDELPTNKLRRLFKLDEETGKYYRRRFQTEKTEAERKPFAFPTKEPLANILAEWIKQAENFLFPGYGERLSYSRAYQIFSKIGIHPHWLRAQRASCLTSFYGWPMEKMMEWMGWEELTTARHYAKYGWRILAEMFSGINYPHEAKELENKLRSS